MRQLLIRVDRGHGEQVSTAASEHNAFDMAVWHAKYGDDPVDMVAVHLENRALGPLLEQLEGLPGLSVSFFPHEVLLVQPPTGQALPEVKELEPRSPLEFFLHSVQSIGNWPSFLAYAVAGAIVVWVAFFTNSIYLLVAAMLVAPFAGPAMHIAVATAAGDTAILKKSLVRYVVAILVTMGVAAALTLLLQQQVVTNLMVGVSHVSAAAVILPLTAGAAGALNLIESDRSSLVSGAAVGILVAASLAPPAGLLGIALVMGLWDSVLNATFILLLQLLGINAGGAVLFRLFGLNADLSRYERGKRGLFFASTAVTVAGLALLLVWQFSGPLRLQRRSAGAEAAQTVRRTIEESELAEVIDVETEFPGLRPEEKNILLVTGYVRPLDNRALSHDLITSQLKEDITRRLLEQNPEAVPLVTLTVVETVSPASMPEEEETR